MCKEKINRNGSFWKHLDLDDIYLADLDLSVDLDLSGDLSDLVAQIEPFRRIRVSSQIMFLGRPDMKSTKFLDLYPPLISKINPLNIRNIEAFFFTNPPFSVWMSYLDGSFTVSSLFAQHALTNLQYA